MSFLQFVFFWLIMYNVSEGRIVQGIIGRNVSFSWTLSNIGKDAIRIIHNKSFFLRVWPAKDFSDLRGQQERVRVAIDRTVQDTVIVNVTYLNVTENDGGIYSVIREWNSEIFTDVVLLKTIDKTLLPKIVTVEHDSVKSVLVLECNAHNISTGEFCWTLNGSVIENQGRYISNNTFLYIMNVTDDDRYSLYRCRESRSGFESDSFNIQSWTNHYQNMTTWEDNTEEISHYSSTAIRGHEDTGGTIHHTTTTLSLTEDTEDFPSKRHLLYIVLGMGSIVTVAFVASRIHKNRICVRVHRALSRNTFTDSNREAADDNMQDENPTGRYWTIVSNVQGEIRSAIETDYEQQRDSLD